jgi:hypothetical protein
MEAIEVKIIIVVIFGVLIIQRADTQEFRHFLWGTKGEDIIYVEGEPSYRGNFALSYNSKEILGYQAETEFMLEENRLYMGFYLITNLSQRNGSDSNPPQAVINAYNDLRRKFTIFYGNPNNINQKSNMPSYVRTYVESQWSLRNSFLTLEIIYQPSGRWVISITYYSPSFANYNGLIMK